MAKKAAKKKPSSKPGKPTGGRAAPRGRGLGLKAGAGKGKHLVIVQ